MSVVWCCVVAVCALWVAVETKSPEEYVNILGGTDSRYDLSNGNVLPLIGRPWGFNTYAPQTDDDPSYPGWWFHPTDRRFFGLRVTHQPSPWIKDYGNFLIKAYMPTNVSDVTAAQDQATGYSPQDSTFSPYYFSTDFYNYCNTNGHTSIEFTPSNHGGMLRVKFPAYVAESGDDGMLPSAQTRRISIELPIEKERGQVIASPIDGTALITGNTTANSGGVGDSNFAHFFVAAVYNGRSGTGKTTFNASTINIANNRIWIDFSPLDSENDNLLVKFATSFISLDQAVTNLNTELIPHTFNSLRSDAQTEWRAALSRVSVTPPSDLTESQSTSLLTIFYSSLYRACLFPRQISELTSDGQVVHWSPYVTASQRVQPGPLSTDSGFWDAWNTIYPLLAIVNRPMLSVTLQGWINSYNEGGWLPKWASPGYRNGMVGTMGDVALAEAIVSDIPDIDVDAAYAAIRKDAFEVPPAGNSGVGRLCLEGYLQNGYIPRGGPITTGGECSEVVSRTLNYLQSDYAIAQAASKLGYTDDAATLRSRYQNYGLTFDAKTGFFRSRDNKTGAFTVPFDQYAWGGDYTEGGPWQFRFYVPYDPIGLEVLYAKSGRDMCHELQKAQTGQSNVHIGAYGSVIHEQTELPAHCWGQYSHNNQPVHHMLYMAMYDGLRGPCSTLGRYWIRQTLTKMYKPGADMFPGMLKGW